MLVPAFAIYKLTSSPSMGLAAVQHSDAVVNTDHVGDLGSQIDSCEPPPSSANRKSSSRVLPFSPP